jgi:hypothetical protein
MRKMESLYTFSEDHYFYKMKEYIKLIQIIHMWDHLPNITNEILFYKDSNHRIEHREGDKPSRISRRALTYCKNGLFRKGYLL